MALDTLSNELLLSYIDENISVSAAMSEPVKFFFWLSNFNIDNLCTCTYHLLCPCTQCLSSCPNLFLSLYEGCLIILGQTFSAFDFICYFSTRTNFVIMCALRS